MHFGTQAACYTKIKYLLEIIVYSHKYQPVLSKETNDEAITEFEAPETYEEKIYKEISYLNGQINRMDLNELKMACKGANVDCHGRKNEFSYSVDCL